jgi:serine/threonine-protein kinase
MPYAPDLSGLALDGRYELHAVIGEGTFGRVYRGRDRRLARPVAVKVIKPWWAEDPNWGQSFEREAQLLARVSDPGIVQIFDVGHAPEGLYYVAELVDGESLEQRLRRGPLAPPDAREVAEQLCRALAQAHLQNIVHRDIKPANVLISARGQVKVGDFGVARLAEGSTEGAATIVGTPRYMAPEQARGLTTTPATDVYSVGVVLYEMLAGRPPFTESSVVELALRHVHDPPPALPAGTPGALAAIVKCALAKSPARRYSSGGTMADALGCARASLAAQDQPRRIGRRAAAAALATAVTRARGSSDHGAVTTVTPPEPQLSDHTTATERLSWPQEHPGATRVKPPLTPRKTVNPAAGRRRAAALTSVFLLLVAMVGAAIVIGSVDHVRVPSLRGLRLASITTRTRRLHLRVSFDNRFSNLPGGTAISQIPATGTRVRDGATVRVVLSAGPPPVELPQLKGQAYAAAQDELQRLGLRAGVTEVPAPGVAAGTVTYQAPAAGSESRLGSTVSLSVAETPRWRPLTSLAGDGRGRSVPFRILGSRWRVLYSMAYQGTCTLIFFCSGPSAQVANQGSGSDTSGFDLNDGSGQTQLFKSGPGLYQITVSPGDDTARWSIQVQDYY